MRVENIDFWADRASGQDRANWVDSFKQTEVPWVKHVALDELLQFTRRGKTEGANWVVSFEYTGAPWIKHVASGGISTANLGLSGLL